MWAIRFFLYGCAGLCLEVLFTGVWSVLVDRDRAATGKTYLWMFPIYGGAALLLERAQLGLGGAPWLVRGLVYVGIIYAVEYGTGALLRLVLGRCPWDYGTKGLAVHGLIRLDYAPAWFLVGLLAEALRPLVQTAVAALSA